MQINKLFFYIKNQKKCYHKKIIKFEIHKTFLKIQKE